LEYAVYNDWAEVLMKPYYDHAGITIYHGDCLEVMPQLKCISYGVCILPGFLPRIPLKPVFNC